MTAAMKRFVILIIVGAVGGAGFALWLKSADDGSAPGAVATSSGGNAARRASDPAQAAAAERARETVVTLEQQAADDPEAALDAALALSDVDTRRRAIERIAAISVASNPLAALGRADELPGALRQAYRAAIDGEWARIDPAGYLDYLETNPGYLEALTGRGQYEAEDIVRRSGGLQLLLASDPESIVDLTDELSSRLGSTLRARALSAFAERDPVAAIARAEQLPQGQARALALGSVAEGYARNDPEGALAWAESLSPPVANAIGNVLKGIAHSDIARAVDLGLQYSTASTGSDAGLQFPAINTIISIAAEDSAAAALAADRLLAGGGARTGAMLEQLMREWADRDPASTLDWLRTNAAGVDERAVAGAAYSIVARDPALAAGYTEQIPPALRGTWIVRVAQGYAAADATAALDWIAQYRGQDGYETGLRMAVTSASRQNPSAAARALTTASPETQLGAAGPVADLWARQDGAAAAEWARSLSDASVRASALPEAVGAWMTQSSQAAEDWTLRLPAGADRDRALYTLLEGRRYSDAPRSSYSTNPTAALIAQIGDAAMRSEVEQWFANAPDR